MVRFAPPDRQNNPARPNPGHAREKHGLSSTTKGKFDEKASQEVRDRYGPHRRCPRPSCAFADLLST